MGFPDEIKVLSNKGLFGFIKESLWLLYNQEINTA